MPAAAEPEEDSGAVEDTSKKYVDVTVTMADLRRHDETWQELDPYTKMKLRQLMREQMPLFTTWPHFDYERDSTAGFAKAFLAQQGAYSWSLDFSPNLFCELAYEGFLSTSMEIKAGEDFMLQVLLPWDDPIRNSLDFHETHVSRQVRKRAKHYTMTVDTAYDEVMLGCIWQHGEAWLYRGLRWLLRNLFKKGYKGSKGVPAGVHSFELWDSDGRLVAGDLGYTVGSVYTSMTGFRLQGTEGAGEVQLVLTSALLHRMGFTWWDLGMVMKYKARLGARTITRDAFIDRLHRDRDKCIPFAHERIGGQELLEELREYISKSSSSASTTAT
eukprot:gnl/TRDRNA2_/TRDRNA2_195659_c0_seq1.p1 gnl/TRDRNA2_/TRDRNA2_195659_c0~~gnl/TRDRNA2_/TRDRNA2_195659_c0_seq1.p1  ORF type:complete len:329 (-),score=66.83 gnl/TRDRNA2_/TRDRNA2_195659_c0_seq1:107-1093(-)